MESGEGVSAPQPPVKKNPLQVVKARIIHTAHGVANNFANRLFGDEEGPQDQSRRLLFKRALGIGIVTAIAVAEHAAAIKALATGVELIKFSDAPDFRNHEYYRTATRNTTYSFTDSAVFENKDTQGKVTRRYVPTGYISFGDSLAWGFVETYDANGRIVVDRSKIQRCSTDTLCANMNDAGAQTLYPEKNSAGEVVAKHPLPVDFEGENLAYPGATIDDIAGQIQQLAKGLGEHPEKYPPIAFDTILAIGGNNALDYLGQHLSLDMSTLDLADKFKTEFITQFKEDMRTLIKGILALRTQGKDSPFIKNMKHLIVSGIPNLGASDQLYFIPPAGKKIEKPEDIPPAQAVPMVPGLKGLATAACKYMNNAILDVIQEIQGTTDFPILFEDIFDVPMHGIHPTEEGYAKIAGMREKRSRAAFFLSPQEEAQVINAGSGETSQEEVQMTYREYINLKRKNTLLATPN